MNPTEVVLFIKNNYSYQEVKGKHVFTPIPDYLMVAMNKKIKLDTVTLEATDKSNAMSVFAEKFIQTFKEIENESV